MLRRNRNHTNVGKYSLLKVLIVQASHGILCCLIAGHNLPEICLNTNSKDFTSSYTEIEGSVAKKPYNPIIGETFNCSYEVPKASFHPSASGPPFTATTNQSDSSPEAIERVTFVSEQVSHHPPVSAFYAECPSLNTYMNGWIWTKSKFLGMSVGVTMVGEGAIHVLERGEVYKAQFPSAYGRSILTIPWMELGGKVLIQCPQTGYQANLTFHTKGEKKTIDTTRYPAFPKRLEERQRREERERLAEKKTWQTKLFHKEGEGWRYSNPLKQNA
ncbi:putative oxysterol-binding protein-related protein 11-like [Apostichopus japonicus]|uniref:Oxysterol-binding protein n=1 Tax=Stichopus japonicus TaxID=307972 RepID=A0A2G8KAX4_STIJA|nr:putative oxysterol-binding protein-related protein 11-like [Apostichopus japonicus]